MVECEFNSFDFCIFKAESFNRYMVECELLNQKIVQICKIVLIDTWWNVNNRPGRIYCSRTVVLIDTWWNVNMMVMQAVTFE